jgi:hypothetical protein
MVSKGIVEIFKLENSWHYFFKFKTSGEMFLKVFLKEMK